MDIDFDEYDKKLDYDSLNSILNPKVMCEIEKIKPDSYLIHIDRLYMDVIKGKRVVVGKFRIIDGDYEDRFLYMRQYVCNDFGIVMTNKFLRSLNVDVNPSFSGFEDYKKLIDECFELCRYKKYIVEYGCNAKGFDTFKIIKEVI